ncbi:putative protein LONGIFOLIA 1/2 [Helianthus annuus]|uniref:DUF4378 domain-containing protein n=1 Tax=Helianthus annuus TaxID=4232 RepID=A0A251SR93_HELAN|nr:protein LONGIFOLIA 2 [Helianthus annuus]KAF5763740.1 putative protein LONGIFOLIA 1/2 [Helianthus annuus]KAJ0450514.1 putative protein LONGIFOLIA [Helianthus annuus]KAJ0472364.1 putative protein LONGIFOLIA [Helianthus annuus]KAJ0647963.1 putative protein LONGIFOLIA [Helianthus annuus]KAJ0651820.1 putative protein LONGIFOLIA [Helianthus annuus]
MSTEVMYTLEKDKQDIQKQLGCMNGIFQLFDRRYLLGQRRNHHKKPLQGKSVTHNKFNNASSKFKDQGPNTVINEKHRESVESSRNSFSSTCSSFDCCKRVQPEPSSFCPSIVSEPASPTLNNKHILCLAPVDNIRDVVKDSMTRKPRAVPVKPVAKAGQKGPTMTHVDSPRLLQPPPKPVPYERRDQNLVKHKETSVPVSMGVKDVKETSRFSYDDRVSPYKLQSYANIKDHPRLSLDSQKSSIKHNANVTREPGSNKPPPSSVVARLMGLDVINCEALKIKPCLDDKTIIVSNALTRIPLEPAPWKQEVEKRANVKVKQRPDHACQSVYDHIEQRLTEVGFRTSGKDLRALKHTLEAMQKTKMKLDNTQPHKSAIKPATLTSDSIVITTLQKVKKVNPGRGHGRNLTPAGTKATGRTKQQVSSSHTTDCLTGVSPKHQRSKIRKQLNEHLIVSSSKIRDRSFRDARHIRNLSEESDASFASQNEPDVDSKDRTRETKNKFAERMMGYKPMAEQPSPVSVLDAFYTEDVPSPMKKKSYAFKDDEDSCFDEQEWSQVDDLTSSTELNEKKLKNIKQHVHQSELQATINPHEDHIYIKEILSASGLLKNLDFATTIVHLHPTGSLINPELFNILEKTKECTSKSEKIKRKLIFDTVNNILVRKLSQTSNRKGKILDAKKLLEELCIEINDLHTNKKSEDWDDDYCNEVPALVLDIERLIFKDLITEIKNVAASGS